MDNELFELCKEVYERTGWDTKARYHVTIKGKSGIWHWEDAQYLDKSERVPLYTSDYLLEKLPKELHKDGIIYYLNLSAKYGDEFKSNYISPSGYLYLFLEPESDTSLKTLLNLVIALDDAKELK